MPASRRAWKVMAAKERQYAAILEFVSKEEEAGNADRLVLGYLSQKAKVESSSPVHGLAAALAINFSWQLAAGLFTPSISTEGLPDDFRLAPLLLRMASSFIVLFVSIFIMYTLFFYNRQEKELLLYKERILRAKGLIE